MTVKQKELKELTVPTFADTVPLPRLGPIIRKLVSPTGPPLVSSLGELHEVM